MKKRGKAWQFFVVAGLILAFAYTAFFGVRSQYGDTMTTYVKGASDIRFGIDIKGGVDVTFMPEGDFDATDEQMDAAKLVIEKRLVSLNITDSEVYTDYNKDRIIVRFPWKSGEEEFDPQSAIDEIGTTAYMTFREGSTADGELILDGAQVKSASVGYGPVKQGGASEFYVSLELNEEGAQAFADATSRLSAEGGSISIWLDEENISVASVNEAITDGKAIISGSFDQESATTLANQINSGALPFALSAESYSTISPSLGGQSLKAMVLAGCLAFAFIFLFMTFAYRLPGFVASIALLGQVAGTLAAISGYFGVFNSFTLTLPGIAGIILAIGMGVDANVITAERIKEELKNGKTIDGALSAGFARGLIPVIDGNVTTIIVAVILMGAFGTSDSLMAKLLHWLFFAFGPSTAGTIYSFGYTLLVGMILNFLFGVLLCRIMLRGASRIKFLRKEWLFGAPSAKKQEKPLRDYVAKRKVFFGISICIVAAVLVMTAVKGVSLDIQFKGGAVITMGYEGEADSAAVNSAVSEVLGSGVTLQTGTNMATGANTLTISMPGVSTVTTEQMTQLTEGLQAACPDNNFQQLEMSNVNPTIGGEFLNKCLVAVAAAIVLILLYISVRFRNIGGLPAGAIAVVALVNDLIVVFGAFVVMGVPLNGNFIAAMLTILGYSINNTVVIYDRIRENRSLYGKKMDFVQLINTSVRQSFWRTMNTTITTCAALAIICVISVLYDVDSILTFAMPLLAGMISGLYTSLFLTTSLWSWWEGRKGGKDKKALAK
ncbi:MAG: protein translocase subunit SecF [Bacteroidales bacterium]|nr:protein translocase subunit SecF [Bacteroidales bacterium]